MHTVLVLGGYGFFGRRICAKLAHDPGIRLLVGGRNPARALAAATDIGLPAASAVTIDAASERLAGDLVSLRVDTLIHAAGPFQGQDYAVARAAIEARCNYMDLADGRRFVADIGTLDAAARQGGVSVVSGASSLPALSSAVVERYLPDFATLEAIRIGIGSGAKAPGLATVQGVFGYCGKPFARWEDGRWATAYGWQDLQRHRFPAPVGARWLASCDVPDLELLPRRFPSVKTVTFHAGFASDLGHLAVWLGARLVRRGVLESMRPLAAPLHRLSGWMEGMVSDKGAMYVELEGVDADTHPLTRRWNLLAFRNHGPYVPCGAAIALTHKLAAGGTLPRGAYACMGLLSVAEYLSPLSDLDLRELPAQEA